MSSNIVVTQPERADGWEIDDPTYRVVIWTPLGGGGYSSDEWDLSGCDVTEAIGWAEEAIRANTQSWVLFAIVPDMGDGPGLIHLQGVDPTSGSES